MIVPDGINIPEIDNLKYIYKYFNEKYYVLEIQTLPELLELCDKTGFVFGTKHEEMKEQTRWLYGIEAILTAPDSWWTGETA